MTGILAKIATSKAAQVAARKLTLPEGELEVLALASQLPQLPMKEYLRRTPGKPINVLAECKKASPSKGILMQDYDPLRLAREYLAGGASGISVLTETEFFLGDDAHLRTVAGSIPLPVLRKDFILERYQILEARCLGASAVLLIAALLTEQQLFDLARAAEDFGLDTILEIHSEWELEPALKAKPSVLGINNRNLDTFEVTLDTTYNVLEDVPKGTVVISESGIFTREQTAALEEAGVDAVLVGESLLTSGDPAAAIQRLKGL